jgi:hypothetical protein
VHEAADAGDVEALRQLLDERQQQLAQGQGQLMEVSWRACACVLAKRARGQAEGDNHTRLRLQDDDEQPLVQLGPAQDPYIQGKDQYECTPLHIAILRGALHGSASQQQCNTAVMLL